MMGATGDLVYSLINEVGGHQGRDQAVVGGAIPQLAVAIMAPGKHLSLCIVNKTNKQWVQTACQ